MIGAESTLLVVSQADGGDCTLGRYFLSFHDRMERERTLSRHFLSFHERMEGERTPSRYFLSFHERMERIAH